MADKKNLYYPGMFDFIKGVAVISIVVTHVGDLFPNEIFRTDRIFSLKWLFLLLGNILSLGNATIPIFLLISGMGFSVTCMKKYVKKQGKYLIKPYMITACLVISVHFCMHYFFFGYLPAALTESFKVLVSYMLGLSRGMQILGIQLFSVGSVWFLLGLFLGGIILNAIFLWVPERYTAGTVVFLVFLGCVLDRICVLPFCLTESFWGAGWMYAGFQIKKNSWLSVPLSYRIWGVIGVFAFISVFLDVYGKNFFLWRLGLIDIVSEACLAFIILWVSVRLNQYGFVWMDKIRMAGRYSLWIICIHTVESQALPWYLYVDYWKEHFAQHLFWGFILLLVMRGMMIIIACQAMIWYNRHRNRRRRKRRKSV